MMLLALKNHRGVYNLRKPAESRIHLLKTMTLELRVIQELRSIVSTLRLKECKEHSRDQVCSGCTHAM
jgi:hypothetical protein